MSTVNGTHGGNIRLASEACGIPENRIIDFSANINPLGLHPSIKRAVRAGIEGLTTYPDHEYKVLRQRLSDHFNIGIDRLLPGNGSVELVYLVAEAFAGKRITIPQPNFSEYAAAFAKWKCDVANPVYSGESEFKPSIDELILSVRSSDAICLSNPNNPTGYAYSKKELMTLLVECEKRCAYLIVDEAFIELSDHYSDLTVIGEVPASEYLVVLRSVTKSFAVPGIRIGFAAGGRRLIGTMKVGQLPWSVNSIACDIAVRSLGLSNYMERSRAYVKRERSYLAGNLSRVRGIEIFDSDANYILCRIVCEKTLADFERYLAGKGVVIRNCSNYPGLDRGYFRVAVRTRRENRILAAYTARFFSV